jgi:probable HAF family extracellular repeat protein
LPQWASPINSTGQVVGTLKLANGTDHGFLWTPTSPNGTSGTLTDLNSLPGISGIGDARGINDSGEVVGDSAGGYFLYSGGHTIGLGVDIEQVNGINSYGQLVGELYTTPNGSNDAFLWTPTSPHGTTGTLTDLGSLVGGAYLGDRSDAYGINSAGQVVGWTQTSSGAGHGFLWTPTSPNATTGTMIDLNTPIGVNNFTLYSATGINDHGQIVGPSSKGAVLLTPTSTTAALAQPASSTPTSTASPLIAASSSTSPAPLLASPTPDSSSFDPAALSVALSLSQPPTTPAALAPVALSLPVASLFEPSLIGTPSGSQASGGAGGSGGNGFGGGLYNDGTSTLTVTGSTPAANQAAGGSSFAADPTAGLDAFIVADSTASTASSQPRT